MADDWQQPVLTVGEGVVVGGSCRGSAGQEVEEGKCWCTASFRPSQQHPEVCLMSALGISSSEINHNNSSLRNVAFKKIFYV